MKKLMIILSVAMMSMTMSAADMTSTMTKYDCPYQITTDAGKQVDLDFACKFRLNGISGDTAHSNWLCDFTVEFDRPVTKDTVELFGQHLITGQAWKKNQLNTMKANTEVRLMGGDAPKAILMVLTPTFQCGVVNHTVENLGTTITVRFKLINPSKTSEFIVLDTVKYTFTNGVEDRGNLFDIRTDLQYSSKTNEWRGHGCKLQVPVWHPGEDTFDVAPGSHINIDDSLALSTDRPFAAYQEIVTTAEVTLTPCSLKTLEGYIKDYDFSDASGAVGYVQDDEDPSVKYLTCLASTPDGIKFVPMQPYDGSATDIDGKAVSTLTIIKRMDVDRTISRYMVNGVLYAWNGNPDVTVFKKKKGMRYKNRIEFIGSGELHSLYGNSGGGTTVSLGQPDSN